ncbi:MAG TPA: hypothetical protein GX709_00400, partial [Clostridiales bacterium]|nr:hypothetical protein [Clostridiales bacterium]
MKKNNKMKSAKNKNTAATEIKELNPGQIKYNNDMHKLGRVFTWIALALISLVPIFTMISTKSGPDWGSLAKTILFSLGFLAIGLIEAFSYAPLLGIGGQYLSFITGNISNLKLPCAINAQQITKVEPGTEEHEIVTTIAIAVSSIVTTLIIIIGLIPLAIYQQEIVKVLKPISPYVMPAIFGALMMVLIAMYWKNSVAPFLLCCIVAVIMHAIGKGSTASISTMVIVGMVLSIITNYIMYNKDKIKAKFSKKSRKNEASKQTEEEDAEKENEVLEDLANVEESKVESA